MSFFPCLSADVAINFKMSVSQDQEFENLDKEQSNDNFLDLPDVSLFLLNREQRFTLNLVPLTLIQYKQDPGPAEPLRLIVMVLLGLLSLS